jgi:hypothetical protein
MLFYKVHRSCSAKKLDKLLLNKFLRLERFIDDITNIDSVKTYLDKRPELIDVSIELKLVIDGVPYPTDINKT